MSRILKVVLEGPGYEESRTYVKQSDEEETHHGQPSSSRSLCKCLTEEIDLSPRTGLCLGTHEESLIYSPSVRGLRQDVTVV